MSLRCPNCNSTRTSVTESSPFEGGTIYRVGKCGMCKQDWNLPPTSVRANTLTRRLKHLEDYALKHPRQSRRAIGNAKRTWDALQAELGSLGQGDMLTGVLGFATHAHTSWTMTKDELDADPIADIANWAAKAREDGSRPNNFVVSPRMAEALTSGAGMSERTRETIKRLGGADEA